MEVSTKQLLPMPPHQQDPNSPSSSTSSSSSSSTSPSSHPGSHHRAQPQPHSHNLPPSPRPVPRTIDTTPFPTTFVQADTTSFKQVVQMLTGAEPQPAAKTDATPPTTTGAAAAAAAAPNGACRPKKPSFKLYERRSSMKNLKMIAPLAMGPPPSPSPRRAPEILSPSVLDFPSLRLSSPVTPLTGDPFFSRSPASTASSEEAEGAAIAERGFFLHPSPRAAAAAEPPLLLPLFPVTSPRMAAPSE